MTISKYKKEKLKKLEKKALYLYKEGLSTREVGKIIGKSHQWVAQVVKKLSTDDKS